jgi:hypothetical protein
MRRKTVKALLPILTAYAEGKTIQYRYYSDNWDNEVGEDGIFNLSADAYRIKPEPKYRPYNNEEMRNLVGKAVVHVNAPNDTYLVTSCIEGCIEVFYNQKSYKYNAEELFRNWTINGKRCGVEE